MYSYRARDWNGKLLSGTILAENKVGAARFIRDQGLYITKINELRQTSKIKNFFENRIPVNSRERAIFCRQFSVMMDAGLPLISCLDILMEQTANLRLKSAARDVYGRVQAGETLSGAMGAHPQVFPVIMTSMIAAGEVGGVLDDVLNRLATHFEKEHIMREKVKSALTYPLVVMGLAVMIASFILTFVLPVFVHLFADMKVELPLLTRLMIHISNFLKEYILFFFIGSLILSCVFFVAVRRGPVRKAVEKMTFCLPVFGLLARRIILARFCRTFSTLLRGGVPMLAALEAVKQTTANAIMMEVLTNAQISICSGSSLSGQLAANHLFTPMAVQMVAVGEETGALDKMLDKIADFYESDVDETINRLSSLLEPVLITFLGALIGGIVIAIAMPLFDVITNFGSTTM
ncbi:MAG: type II secretion system F family protein [Negativicutes bacterium]